MVQFFIQSDSDITASTQLFDQLSFAITSGQYSPGCQLPSTRQLAQWTGLHRNTINKVYQQLKQSGLVESRGGSGMYVSEPNQNSAISELPLQTVRQSLDNLLGFGCSLVEARELFLAEIDWRLSCNAQLLITYGHEDPGVATIMAEELERRLSIVVQMVAVEELAQVLEHTSAGTIVTNRYLLDVTRKAVGDRHVRVIAIDIYDYKREIDHIRQLPVGSFLGLVSISTGVLRLAESLIHSLRGDEIVVVSALPQDTYRLQSIVRSANLIICGNSGKEEVKVAIAATRDERIRPVEVIYSDNYIANESIELLRRELGLEMN